jgi:hypothetical protein
MEVSFAGNEGLGGFAGGFSSQPKTGDDRFISGENLIFWKFCFSFDGVFRCVIFGLGSVNFASAIALVLAGSA